MRNRGYIASLEAGLLSEDNIGDTSVVDGESVLEEISNGCEDIIPDGYTEIDGEMTVVENLADAVEEEEVIMEEVELPMVETGTESDFNANVLKMLAASNRRLNTLMGVDERRGAPVAALESDVYGGYKKAFMAGLEAKEGFLKNLKENVAKGAKAILDTIKKWIQKALVFFNGAEKSSRKLKEILDKKETKATDAKLSDSDKQALADKFGAWIILGGTVSNYLKYASELTKPAVPEAGKKVPLRDAGISSMPLVVSKGLELGAKDQWSILNLTGNVGKYLVMSTDYFEGMRGPKTGKISLALADSEIDSIAVRSFKSSTDAKDVKETEIPTLAELNKFNDLAARLAVSLKSASNENYSAAESFPKAIKALGETEAAKATALENVSKVATRCALENIGGYMSAMKTILWYVSTFAKKYPDAGKADKK